MMMAPAAGRTYLGLTTYPVKQPIHGGQRRVAAIGRHLERLGIRYVTAAVYERESYTAAVVSENDVPLGYVATAFQGLPFIGDILAGLYAAQDDQTYRHFVTLIARLTPAALVLEHPFMWPLVERLRADPAVPRLPLIYSSHNWESPLKADILRRSGVPETTAQTIQRHVLDLEQKVCAAASLVIAVSEADADKYRAIAPSTTVLVARNGIERPAAQAALVRHDRFGTNKTFFFVGSAYPPNIEGFCDLVVSGSLFFMPPEKHLAVCGGAGDGIFADQRYQAHLCGNSERVHFFPKIDDTELASIKGSAHAALLPITYGGGTNLKTAEAISMNCHIVATPMAFRGFEAFMPLTGVQLASDALSFRRAMIDVFHAPPLVVPEEEKIRRDAVFWDRCFDAVTADLLPDAAHMPSQQIITG